MPNCAAKSRGSSSPDLSAWHKWQRHSDHALNWPPCAATISRRPTLKQRGCPGWRAGGTGGRQLRGAPAGDWSGRRQSGDRFRQHPSRASRCRAESLSVPRGSRGCGPDLSLRLRKMLRQPCLRQRANSVRQRSMSGTRTAAPASGRLEDPGISWSVTPGMIALPSLLRERRRREFRDGVERPRGRSRAPCGGTDRRRCVMERTPPPRCAVPVRRSGRITSY